MANECKASNFIAFGSDSATAQALEEYSLPHLAVQDIWNWTNNSGLNFSFFKLLAFCRKYGPIVPELISAYKSGGWFGVAAVAAAHVKDLPDMLKDFLDVFGASEIPTPSPVVEG